MHHYYAYLGAMIPTFLFSRALFWIARLASRGKAKGLWLLLGANALSLVIATGIAAANFPAFNFSTLLSAFSLYAPPQLVWLGVDLWRRQNGLAPLLSSIRKSDSDAKM